MTGQAPPALRLFADGLFSKWGFGDGDQVDDFLWDHLDYDDDVIHARLKDVDDHAVLRRLVREHLVPAFAAAGHDVEVYDIETNHNPVRAGKLDGVEVGWDVIIGEAPEPQLRLEYVDVPFDTVLRAAGLEVVPGEVFSG